MTVTPEPEGLALLFRNRPSLSAELLAPIEAIMASGNYEYQGPFAKRYVAEGKAEGLRQAVIALCDVLGIALSAGPARGDSGRRTRRALLGAASRSALAPARRALK